MILPGFQLTKIGIPNSCCVCGKMQHVKWYAQNDDEARSGQGRCLKDATKPKAPPKKRTKRKVASAKPKAEQQTKE